MSLFMKKYLVEQITSWSEAQADAFHRFSLKNSDEDRKYIWIERPEGILLYKDVNAVFFHKSGEVHKLSVWSNQIFWNYHCRLFDELSVNATCLIEEPKYFEYIKELNMGYSIVIRPGGELGYGMIERALSNDLTQTDIEENIDSIAVLLQSLDQLNKKYEIPYPFPPKQFANSTHKFWADFKYWKYTKQQFIENYQLAYKRFLPILVEDYGLEINSGAVREKLYGLYKV